MGFKKIKRILIPSITMGFVWFCGLMVAVNPDKTLPAIVFTPLMFMFGLIMFFILKNLIKDM